jgi:flagellar biogenesis protein FliO
MFAFSEDILNINNLNKKIGEGATRTQSVSPPSSGNALQWVSFFVTLLAIIVILFFIYKILKRKSVSSVGLINILDTVYLDNNTKISIVKIGESYFAMAFNSNSIVKLMDITDDSMIETLKLDLKSSQTFKDIFLSKTTKNFTLQKAKDRLNKLK